MLTPKRIALWLLFLAPLLAASQADKVPPSGPSSSDSALVAPNRHYEPHSFLRRLLMGNNYRREWAEPVKLPVFRLSQSGFTVEELGGGMQTKSLHLRDSAGRHWSLRTVNKFVTDAALTEALRNQVGRNLGQDLISAAYPFAAPLAGELARLAGVAAASPQAFVVADDPALTPFQQFFSGAICTLEERDTGFDSTDESETLLANIRRDSRYQVNQAVYLRARLLDILTADWDRHADNWRWGLNDSAGYFTYAAVPRDRDWAFYHSRGMVPWLARISGSVPCLLPFTSRLKNVKKQSWKAWAMDAEFTNALAAADWKEIIEHFCAALTDEGISRALQVLPASVRAMDSGLFRQRLTSRRDMLSTEVMKYYRFLAQEVTVNGSAASEVFHLQADGALLRLTVYRNDSGRKKIYERSFAPGETVVVTLNGYGGRDSFFVDQQVQSPIRLRIYGSSTDSYELKGRLRKTVYNTDAKNAVLYKGRSAFAWTDRAAQR